MLRVLIISTNAIGDTYLSASSIKVINNKYKDTEIDFLTTQECQPLVELLPLEKIYTIRKNLIELLKTMIKIRKNKYDYVFSFFPGIVNTLFFLISKGNKKSGFINFLRRSDWYDLKQKVTIKGTKPIKLFWNPDDNYLNRVKLPLSVFFDLETDNYLQKKILEISDSEALVKDSIVIHPFSRSRKRALNMECLQKLINYLEKYRNVYIIGLSKDFESFSFPTNKILCDLSIVTLMKIIISAKLFIAVDSFPIHIADAHNVNFIGIFGPTNPKSVLVNFNNAIRFNTKRIDELLSNELIDSIDEHVKRKLV